MRMKAYSQTGIRQPDNMPEAHVLRTVPYLATAEGTRNENLATKTLTLQSHALREDAVATGVFRNGHALLCSVPET